jgi:hypothetical protein
MMQGVKLITPDTIVTPTNMIYQIDDYYEGDAGLILVEDDPTHLWESYEILAGVHVGHTQGMMRYDHTVNEADLCTLDGMTKLLAGMTNPKCTSGSIIMANLHTGTVVVGGSATVVRHPPLQENSTDWSMKPHEPLLRLVVPGAVTWSIS